MFGLGFVVRPLGAVLIGDYGDRAGPQSGAHSHHIVDGRRHGHHRAVPTYASIGFGAPLLLLLGRVLQGFSAGGEVGGATAYLLESAPLEQRGRVASWLEASMGLANILGALAAFSVTALLTTSQVQAWGWRLPFLFGLAIAPVGLYLRRTLEETDAFQAEAGRRAQNQAQARAPLLEIFRNHGSRLFVGFCVAVLWAVAVYVLMIYLPTYVQHPDTFNFSARQAFGAALIGNIPFVIGCLWFGSLSDRIGRRTSLSSQRRAAARFGAAAVHVAEGRSHAGNSDRRAIHHLHPGRELRRRRSGGVVGNLSHRQCVRREPRWCTTAPSPCSAASRP